MAVVLGFLMRKVEDLLDAGPLRLWLECRVPEGSAGNLAWTFMPRECSIGWY